MFVKRTILALCLVCVAHAEPTFTVTILRDRREKSCGLDAQLAALRPTNGTLIVRTNETAATASDFELRFSWRSSEKTPSSNAAPTLVAAEIETARKTLLAAMTDSYPEEVLSRVTTETLPKTQTNCWEVIFPRPRSGVSLARQFRLARRLVLMRLSEMNMMKPLAGTWPTEFRPPRALALYDAEGVGYYGSTLLERAVDETTLDACTVAVCPEDIREGILERCIGVLFPGGTGRGIAEALQPDGVQRVREFVARGGGYFGVCAGAYFATSGRPEYTGMIPLKHDLPWAKGRGTLKVELTAEGAALLGTEFTRFETPYNCGPVFRDWAGAPITVLAHFASPVTSKKGSVHQEMVGTPAILAMTWQKGRIMIVSPHPEAKREFCPLVARAIGWTIGVDPNHVKARIPPVKP